MLQFLKRLVPRSVHRDHFERLRVAAGARVRRYLLLGSLDDGAELLPAVQRDVRVDARRSHDVVFAQVTPRACLLMIVLIAERCHLRLSPTFNLIR